jgi:predicted transcriptional regulator of viral defense system
VSTLNHVAQASLLLHRLQEADEIMSIKKGLWLLDQNVSPFFIGEHVARPYPAYVSLQSALYLHGMISQIPETIYLTTLGRSQKKMVQNSM